MKMYYLPTPPRGGIPTAEDLTAAVDITHCLIQPLTTSGEPVPTYGHYDPVDRHPGVGGSKNKRRPTRRARPKKSNR